MSKVVRVETLISSNGKRLYSKVFDDGVSVAIGRGEFVRLWVQLTGQSFYWSVRNE